MERPIFLWFTIAAGIASILSLLVSVHQLKGGEAASAAALWQVGFTASCTALLAVAFLWWFFQYRPPFADLRMQYTIEILDKSGNAIIARRALMAVQTLGAVSQRRHEAFSDGTPMRWQDMRMKAHDAQGNALVCRLLNEGPTLKCFAVQFHSSLKWPQKLDYTYEYRWDRYLACSDFFLANDACKQVTIQLVLPAPVTVRRFIGLEVFPQGYQSELAGSENIGSAPGLRTYTYRFFKRKHGNKLRCEWDLDWP